MQATERFGLGHRVQNTVILNTIADPQKKKKNICFIYIFFSFKEAAKISILLILTNHVFYFLYKMRKKKCDLL